MIEAHITEKELFHYSQEPDKKESYEAHIDKCSTCHERLILFKQMFPLSRGKIRTERDDEIRNILKAAIRQGPEQDTKTHLFLLKRKKKFLPLAAAAVLLSIFVFVRFFHSPEQVATFTFSTNNKEMIVSKTSNNKAGLPFSLKTKKMQRCTIDGFMGSRLRFIGPGQMEISYISTKKRLIKLHQGTILIDTKGPIKNLEIQTSRASYDIIGTKFICTSMAKKDTLLVLKGKIKVRSKLKISIVNGKQSLIISETGFNKSRIQYDKISKKFRSEINTFFNDKQINVDKIKKRSHQKNRRKSTTKFKETLYLKDNTVIKGIILSIKKTEVVIWSAKGTLVIERKKIKRIVTQKD